MGNADAYKQGTATCTNHPAGGAGRILRTEIVEFSNLRHVKTDANMFVDKIGESAKIVVLR